VWIWTSRTKQTSELNTENRAIFAENGFEGAQVQVSSVKVDGKEIASAVVRTKELSATTPNNNSARTSAALTKVYGEVKREPLQSVVTDRQRRSNPKRCDCRPGAVYRRF
jgi:predicted acetyltransferase